MNVVVNRGTSTYGLAAEFQRARRWHQFLAPGKKGPIESGQVVPMSNFLGWALSVGCRAQKRTEGGHAREASLQQPKRTIFRVSRVLRRSGSRRSTIRLNLVLPDVDLPSIRTLCELPKRGQVHRTSVVRGRVHGARQRRAHKVDLVGATRRK